MDKIVVELMVMETAGNDVKSEAIGWSRFRGKKEIVGQRGHMADRFHSCRLDQGHAADHSWECIDGARVNLDTHTSETEKRLLPELIPWLARALWWLR